MQEDVLLFDLGKHGAGLGHLGGILGHPFGIQQGILPGHVLDAVHEGQIQGGFCREDLTVLDAQLLPEEVRGGLVEAGGQLDPHRHQFLPLLYKLLHDLPEVVGVIVEGIRYRNVRTAGDPQQGTVNDLEILEDGGGQAQNQILRQNETLSVFSQRDHPLELLVYGDDAQPDTGFGFQVQHGVDLLVFQKGEGMLLVHHHGYDQRADLLLEVGVQKAALLVGGGGVGDLHDPMCPQCLHDLPVGIVPLGLQLPNPAEDGLQLLLGVHAAAGIGFIRVGEMLIVQGANPHPEKFVQIGLENGGEFQSLQQGGIRIACLLQYTLVEFEPGELPVVIALKSHIGSFLRRCRNFFFLLL